MARPEPGATALVAQLHRAGWAAMAWPVMVIEPAQTPPHLSDSSQWVIYISANAVRFALPRYPQLVALRSIAIGRATAAALTAATGREPITAPPPYNSEAALQLPPLQPEAIAGESVTIVRGEGGREWLSQQLKQRGAEVNYLEVYRRRLPTASELPPLSEVQWQQIAAVVVTSGEVLQNLVQLVPPLKYQHRLKRPLVVISEGMVQQARQLGFAAEAIVLAANASSEAIIAALGAIFD